MASIRHNRVFLTVAMVLAIGSGSLIALGSQGWVWRSLGATLVALGLAMPFWISLGQNKDQRRRINTIVARQIDSVHRETDQAESMNGLHSEMKGLQSEMRDLTLQVESLSQRLRGVETSTGNAQQDILIRMRQLSMSLIELARHQDAARDEFARFERRLAESFDDRDILTR